MLRISYYRSLFILSGCCDLFGTGLVAYSANTLNSSFGVTDAAFYRKTYTGPDVMETTATSSYAYTLTTSADMPVIPTLPTAALPILVLSFGSAVVH